jgi:hypothetical protein
MAGLRHDFGKPLAPRIPFWIFATEICGLNQPDSKVQLTTAQRALWKSYDRQIPLTGPEGEVYTAMTGKPPWVAGSKAPPFLQLVLGRGSGKSLLLATIAVYEGLTNAYIAAPGEKVAVIAIAPRTKQAKDMLGYARAHLSRPELAPLVSAMPADDIILRNGRVIRIVAVDTQGGGSRGTTNICGLFDESAFLGIDGKIVDADQWAAIVAGSRGVDDFHGVLSSTPNGKSGFFWETFDECHGVDSSAWEVFLGPQPIMRPEMSPGIIAEFRRTSGEEAYRREFLCDFEAGSGVEKFFAIPQVEACVQGGVIEVPPGDHTIQYVCAVDPTGGAHDLMTMCVVERLSDGSVRQCLTRGWDPKIAGAPTVHDIAREIAGLVEPYGIRTVYGDIFGGAWVSEAFAAVGIEYETRGFGGPQKVQRASLLRELFAAHRIELLDCPPQTKEFREYEKKTLHSGAVSVNHPMTKDGSDDYLDALALATWELVGNDVKNHPPEVLKKWDPKRWKKDLFGEDKYPSVSPERSDTVEKIIAKGEGPAWVLKNWSKDWRYCQCSLGELSWLLGVGPIQAAGVLGADLVLQSAWMRWVLAYHKHDTDFILRMCFKGIPGFEEVKDRIIRARGTDGIVTYEAASSRDWNRGCLPEDWQPRAVKSRNEDTGVSKSAAFPPWTKPPEEWGLLLDVNETYDGWPDRPWAGEIKQAFRSKK